MITLKDVRKAINRQLAKTGIEINSRDVEEGFNTPSFFVQFNNANREGTETQVGRDLIVSIYYFPTDRYEYAIEVLDMQETLENLFDLKLRVEDRYFNIDNFSQNLNDGVLNCTFDLEFIVARNKEWMTDEEREFRENYPIEKMQELDIENMKE